MRLFKTFILIHLVAVCYAQLNWEYSTLNEAKTEMDVATHGNKIFFYSGYKKVGNSTVAVQQLELFDVRTGSKITTALSGDEITQKMAITTSGSKVYFAGGAYYDKSGIYNKKVRIFDTLTSQWTVQELSQARCFFSAAAANGKILFGGGFGTNEPNKISKIVDIYDELNHSWTQTGFIQSIPSEGSQRRNLTAAAAGDKLFFAGGEYLGYPRSLINIYDSKQGKWLPNATLSQKKAKLKSIVYDNKIFFVGGVLLNEIPSDSIDIYDNTTDSWYVQKIPYLFKRVYNGEARPYVQAVKAGCKMFLLPLLDFSGSIPHKPERSSKDSVAVYDFARDRWSYIGIPQPVFGTTMAAAENKVYFAGGTEVATGLYTNLISILTLQPKLQSSVENSFVNSHNYGDVVQGEEKTVNIDFSNEGDYDLRFANLASRTTITGDLDDFSIDFSSLQAKDILAPAESISLPVTFHPTGMGTKQLTLILHSNDPEQPDYTFTVQGTGTEITDVQDAIFSKNLIVYPNPTTGLLYITSKNHETLSVDIISILGTSMKETQYIHHNEAIDLSPLQEGLYFLKVANATSSAVVKILKE